MISDFHLHTHFSSDSTATPESIIEAAIAKGMKNICITDHQDFDFVEKPGAFMLDYEAYYEKMCLLRKQYQSIIDIGIGVETGLEPYLKNRLDDFISKIPYDYIIGSTHLVNRTDPYFPAYFNGRSERSAYM